MANGHDGDFSVKELNKNGCEYGRRLQMEVADMKKDLADVIENLQNRPSWTVAMAITTMSSIIVGLSVALIAG